MKTREWILMGGLAFGFLGCGPKMIPGMEIDVPDTPDSRAVLKLFESYRDAMDQKNIESLAGLASKRFYETCGTSDTSDDYNLDGLRQHFTDHWKRIDKVLFNYKLRSVQLEKDTGQIDYQYVGRYLLKMPSGDKWQIVDNINRMEVVKEDGQWKILSGM